MECQPGFTLRENHWREIVAHLERCLPEEACGLLGGKDAISEVVIPVTNRLHSPTRFTMEPQEQFNAFAFLDKHEYNLLAIFHSHPNGPSIPSETDLEEFAYSGVLSVICAPREGDWHARAFQIDDQKVVEVPLQICR